MTECPPTWVIDGTVVADAQITGVFLRRSAFYPEEFQATHPADRAYLAAECQAFLVALLDSSAAVIANPVNGGAFGEDALRPERWMAAAQSLDLPVAPLRVQATQRMPPPLTSRVDVVGDEVHGISRSLRPRLVQLVRALQLPWATLLLDERERLVGVTGALAPSDVAATALAALLQGARG